LQLIQRVVYQNGMQHVFTQKKSNLKRADKITTHFHREILIPCSGDIGYRSVLEYYAVKTDQ
jgi:hypothetical protein